MLLKKSSVTPASLTEEAKQEQLLNEAKQIINVQAFQMKRALDANNIGDALKCASHIISELRTGVLSPKTYYGLYIFTVDQLRHLEVYISEGAHGRSMHELYELIQCAGNILPRLYLMVTVGAVFIKKMEAPAKDLLNDLVELCRGVQHPTRGLFLRTYLSEMTKDKLPDEGSKYEGDVNDSISFILVNFIEMNKLWVRMQHGIHNLSKREQEREELNVLVGKNLSRLSQLDGLNKDLYKDNVLPRILTQVVQCKDRIAQQYLMVIVIQVFSDEFHLHTVNQMLEICLKLEAEVKFHLIINSLIERIGNHCATHSLPSGVNLFQLFKANIEQLSNNYTSIKLENTLQMANALLSFSLRCYKDNLDNIDSIFEFAKIKIESCESPDPSAINQIVILLQTPVTFNRSIRPMLKLKNYPLVFALLPYKEKREMSLFIIDAITQNSNSRLTSVEEVSTTLEYLNPIVKRPPDVELPPDNNDQFKISCFITLLYTTDIGIMFNILVKTKEYFTDKSMIDVLYSIVPLIYKGLQLVQNIYKQKESDNLWEKKAQKVCNTIGELVQLYKSSKNLYLTFQLFLQCALQTGKCGIGKFAYGFLYRALEMYEDEGILQSKESVEALTQLTGVVQSLGCFDLETSEKLSKRVATHSIKIPTPKDQVRIIAVSSHLFLLTIDNGANTYRDTKSAISCLRKAFSILQTLEDVSLKGTLFVELLDHFIYFFDKHPDVVEANTVNLMAVKVTEHFTEHQISPLHPSSVHLKSITQIVEHKKKWQHFISSSKKETSQSDEIEIKEDFAFSEADAKKEATKWKEITINFS